MQDPQAGRVCARCETHKGPEAFYLYRGKLHSWCKDCQKASSKTQQRTVKTKPPGYWAAYQRKNPEKFKAAQLRWNQANSGRRNAWSKAYQTRKAGACPPWADMDAIEAIYTAAQTATATTGVPHDVDHIVPLTHPDVCGLHVPWNLQVLTASVNRSKSNSFTTANSSQVHRTH